ncbi:MAG TPA: hypothetical protein VKE24_09195 [Candidatus Acidoferrales bacterium]|nr:hypothetical protein [Candidatus Acidoferrales bacterium]
MGDVANLVFISCGQVTERERRLGIAVAELIRRLTPYEPYFAENQSSLEGLTKNLLAALNRSMGLIAIMHPRGTVTFASGQQQTRASVWIEQEIAIAAFIAQVLGRQLRVAAYIHKDIAREGMREELQLNPVMFRHDEEVLAHLRQLLPTWKRTSWARPP